MKILYGTQGTGERHLSRTHAAVPLEVDEGEVARLKGAERRAQSSPRRGMIPGNLYLRRTYRQLVKAFPLSTALVAVSLGAAFAGEIRHFQNVNDWLYRGGRPSQEDVAELREMGIKTILDLEAGLFVAETDPVKLERDWAAAAGINFEHVPLGPLGAPRADQVDAALAVLLDPAKRPIFVHCKAGVDRTGFVVAAYRVKAEGWTAEQAYEEMVRLGFHSFLFWWPDAFFQYVGAPPEAAAPAEANRRSVNRYDNTRRVRGRTYRSRGN